MLTSMRHVVVTYEAAVAAPYGRWESVKCVVPDAVVLVRSGDCYVTFGADCTAVWGRLCDASHGSDMSHRMAYNSLFTGRPGDETVEIPAGCMVEVYGRLLEANRPFVVLE